MHLKGPSVTFVDLGNFDRTWLRRATAVYVTFGLIIVVHFVGLVTGTQPVYLTTAVLGPVAFLAGVGCLVVLLRTRPQR